MGPAIKPDAGGFSGNADSERGRTAVHSLAYWS
jgi:hypothetical protein